MHYPSLMNNRNLMTNQKVSALLNTTKVPGNQIVILPCSVLAHKSINGGPQRQAEPPNFAPNCRKRPHILGRHGQ